MAYGNLFHAEIGTGLYLISTDAQGKSMLPGKATTNSYLVVGDEKALLFDLAVDEPELLEYALSLAGKPVMLVLSHAHPDHIYHLNRWHEVWLHPADEKFLHGGILGMAPVTPCPELCFLDQDDKIDLGNRILDVIHIPGHTPGSILLLDRKTKLLLSGDTGARRLLYGITDLVPMEFFCSDLVKLKSFNFECMYSAHDRCALRKSHVDRMLDVLQTRNYSRKQTVFLPELGKLFCMSVGEELSLEYFEVGILEDCNNEE